MDFNLGKKKGVTGWLKAEKSFRELRIISPRCRRFPIVRERNNRDISHSRAIKAENISWKIFGFLRLSEILRWSYCCKKKIQTGWSDVITPRSRSDQFDITEMKERINISRNWIILIVSGLTQRRIATRNNSVDRGVVVGVKSEWNYCPSESIEPRRPPDVLAASDDASECIINALGRWPTFF